MTYTCSCITDLPENSSQSIVNAGITNSCSDCAGLCKTQYNTERYICENNKKKTNLLVILIPTIFVIILLLIFLGVIHISRKV